ncbi:zf-MYND and TPR domain-containing protein [Skeletonema marinoi]|uniref:Zf-MYND and TPR domain-containing protein n=1 Tax=Skeletonema marinoi TaxID=267567 RepID=A0AAD9DI78_9STRA|nr:zf-MYND and TPR domain-containing protein [Skeletonema marinoi]
MSKENVEADDSCCASCGVAEIDDIKLTECSDCDLVRYCTDACQKGHKSQHQQECKKRAAELREELLFKQPESTHRGDCPICCLPLSLDRTKSIMTSCCCKVICKGCDYANYLREEEAKLGHSCPFCRKPVPSTDKQCDKQILKRIAANDPVAMLRKGIEQHRKGDYGSAFEYYVKAAKLGDAEAQYELALLYQYGTGVEKDEVKQINYLEEAAIGGHPNARYNLGRNEWNIGNTERALKHFFIAAKLGDNDSTKVLMDAFRDGLVSKDDLASALRAHQAAVDATKSLQRDITP